MKKIFFLALATLITLAPVQQSKASEITTSVVVGVLVAGYAGPLAGVGASSLLFSSAVLVGAAGKDVALKEAQNDVQKFYSTGILSASLENSITSLQTLDSDLSEEEAMDLIIEALQ